MKKTILIGAVLGLFACNSATQEIGYTINVSLIGEPSEFKSDTLLLTNRGKDTSLVEQVAVLENGKATFTGTVVTPENYTILFKGERGGLSRLFLENEKYDVTIPVAQPKEAKIVGGTTQQVIATIEAKTEAILKAAKLDSLMAISRDAKTSEEDRKMISATYQKATAEITKLREDYSAANPTSLYALNNFLQKVGDMPLDSADAKLIRFKAAYPTNRNVATAEKIVNILKSLQTGMIAPDFTQNDPDGNPVKFSDVYSKNKVTMIDFWASWCGPCRKFNPTLVKIYKEYKKKGLEIVGVSFDSNHDSWVKGIKDDNLTWIQVSDLGGWQNAVGAQYYIKSIPQNIFVDQTGKIIKRDATEEESLTILKENLK